ncbi:MAG: GxxExxY protein [Planctomycetes bacterium]|nr:GxxExxY protein [Planctomycetota bacterium]
MTNVKPDQTDRTRLNEITEAVIGAAIKVHRALGPGLLESAYEACVVYELQQLKIPVERQKALPLMYEDVKLDCGYRLDLLVAGCVVVELKSVEKLTSVHEAQMISYLKLSGCRVGPLINFNVKVLKNGVRRVVSNF